MISLCIVRMSRIFKAFSFVILLGIDVTASYKLMEAFPDGDTRIAALFLCLLFVNVSIIAWVKFLTLRSAEFQKRIILRRFEKGGLATRSLYEVMQMMKSWKARFSLLYQTELVFTAFATLLVMANGVDSFVAVLPKVFDPVLLPYYVGFCFSVFATIGLSLLRQEEQTVLDDLRKEFVIKVLQTVFISALYGIGPVLPFIVLTAFLRVPKGLFTKSQ
jgi:hypothetical protein